MIVAIEAWSVNAYMRPGLVMFDTKKITCIAPQMSANKPELQFLYYEIYLDSGTMIALKEDVYKQFERMNCFKPELEIQ